MSIMRSLGDKAVKVCQLGSKNCKIKVIRALFASDYY